MRTDFCTHCGLSKTIAALTFCKTDIKEHNFITKDNKYICANCGVEGQYRYNKIVSGFFYEKRFTEYGHPYFTKSSNRHEINLNFHELKCPLTKDERDVKDILT